MLFNVELGRFIKVLGDVFAVFLALADTLSMDRSWLGIITFKDSLCGAYACRCPRKYSSMAWFAAMLSVRSGSRTLKTCPRGEPSVSAVNSR